MAAKNEAKPAPAAAEKPAESVPVPAAPAEGIVKKWLPAMLAIILAPAATYAIAQFVLLPRLQAKLAAPPAAGAPNGADAALGHAGETPPEAGKGGHGGTKAVAVGNYEFTNVVVNLAGTMGTRYLKTSFIVTGVNKGSTMAIFEEQKAKLTDITLNVLSSLTLADLEEPGSKNVLREKLVSAYNQTLGKRLVEQVYFSDFVIQ